MSIRYHHTHASGRRCFQIKRPYLYEKIHLLRFGDADLAATYARAEKVWKIIDLSDGQQVGTVDPKLFLMVFAPFEVGSLKWNPGSVVCQPIEEPLFGDWFEGEVPEPDQERQHAH